MDKRIRTGIHVAVALLILATLVALTEPKQKPIILRAGTYCEWIGINESAACNGTTLCYANKGTADKFCIDQGYEQAMSYTYSINSVKWADRWNGTAWVNTTTNAAVDVAPKGGGGVYVNDGHGDTTTITLAYCCNY